LLTDYAHKVAGLPRVYLEIEPTTSPAGASPVGPATSSPTFPRTL